MPAVALDDGRTLAYDEHGDPDGLPVVLLHGAPGSRRFLPDADAVGAAGVRLVTFDRPGFGRSTRRPGRELLDTATDVAALLERLHIERAGLIGVSAGGPHALACAVSPRLRGRVAGLTIVSAPGPLDEVPGAWESLGDHMRPTAAMARREPSRSIRAIERYMAPAVADPCAYLQGGPPADRALQTDPAVRPMLLADLQEAFRQGAAGLADDLVAFWRPWGFRVADVPPGARLWHGEQDTRGAADAAYLARALPACRAATWPDAGHFAVVTHWRDVLHAAAAGVDEQGISPTTS
ncbi:MAG: alpha/beta hydrolase [Actinobacteria bacterium]|nr:alpha/beta hydrolase [Actinomycetota bacterium]